jgi:glycosyltransferase involved in cell wall biosynthesis
MNVSARKRVLILIPNFLPGYKMGGPLSSMVNLIDNLSDNFSFEVLTSDRDLGDSQPYSNISFNMWLDKGNYKVCYLRSGLTKAFNLLKFINQSEAEYLYLNSLFSPLFSVFVLLSYKLGFINSKKIILAPRGETFSKSLSFKSRKKISFLLFAKIISLFKNIYWHASTSEEKEAIINNIGISDDKIMIALNLPQKKSIIENIDSFSKDIDTPLRIVYLSRVCKEKNLIYTFDILEKITSPIDFDLYGPIEDGYIWKSCQERIKLLPKNIQVNYLGAVSKEKVKEVLLQYDLMFLPTFSENYGHAIVESLTVGTPVLISDNTPWRNLKEKGFGWDISLDNPEAFVVAIEDALAWSVNQKIDQRKKIIECFQIDLYDPKVLEENINLFSI